MKLNIYKNLIYEFEEFLTKEEQEQLLFLATSLGDNWNNGSNDYWKDKNGKIEDPIMNKIELKVRSFFENISRINTIDAINRFRPGDEMGIHSDEVGSSEIQYGVVIYINDDFNGGEICYPTLDIIHKPKARSLIIHPGNLPHLVNKITDGPIRYSITTFVFGTKENPVRLSIN